jgi:hypothetical protein
VKDAFFKSKQITRDLRGMNKIRVHTPTASQDRFGLRLSPSQTRGLNDHGPVISCGPECPSNTSSAQVPWVIAKEASGMLPSMPEMRA